MSKAGSKSALLTAAMFVAGTRLWMQVRGKAKTPFREWAVGWSATFFILSLLSEASPSAAGSLSLVVAFSDFLVNGVSLTGDLSKIVTGTEKGNLFVPNPFATQAASAKVSGTAPHKSTPPALSSTPPPGTLTPDMPGYTPLSMTPPPGTIHN